MDQNIDPQLEHTQNKKLVLSILVVIVIAVGIAAFVGSKDYRIRKSVEKRAFEKNPNPELVESTQKSIERRAFTENREPSLEEEVQQEIKNRSLE